MLIMGIDIGTTHTKVGVFRADGTTVAVSAKPTVTHEAPEGYSYYDPEQLWEMIAGAIRETAEQAAEPIRAIGIASMAESGLLVDRATGKPRSIFMPWFDRCSEPQARQIAREADLYERFRVSGIHGSFKLGLPKLMWLRERDPDAFAGSAWLSASGYVAYRLTGKMAFDYSLAARTFAFDISAKQWDADWVRNFGIDPAIFPEAHPAGTAIGRVEPGLASGLGLSGEIEVAIAGHDHVASAIAVGAVAPDVVYDSMGTAETLVGTLEERRLGRAEYESGLSFGCHAAPGRLFWMGGQPSSGGSVEWLRGVLGDPQLSYGDILALLDEGTPAPSGILYFPYLAGTSAPMPDAGAKAAFVGLTKDHGRADLIKAVLEGTSYQLQFIREAAERIAGRPIRSLRVVGGGTRNPWWLQAKADILGATLHLPPIEEASLLGAALCAGAGAGVYASMDEAARVSANLVSRRVDPDESRHRMYRRLYENGFLPLQTPLRACFKSLQS